LPQVRRRLSALAAKQQNKANRTCANECPLHPWWGRSFQRHHIRDAALVSAYVPNSWNGRTNRETIASRHLPTRSNDQSGHSGWISLFQMKMIHDIMNSRSVKIFLSNCKFAVLAYFPRPPTDRFDAWNDTWTQAK